MDVEDFASFHEAVHGLPPFPWQIRLARRVVERGWPSVIDLPTGAGKTTVLDVAIFTLALQGRDRPRRAPRRIAYMVDRRLLVDTAQQRGKRLQERLTAARNSHGTGVLNRVADALMSLGDGERPLREPLSVARLRGGLPRDETWLRDPRQPLIISSTIDQIGSRLLFRGYGLRQTPTNQLSLSAGLLANDTLFILDEAHISRPMQETLEAVEGYRRTPWVDCPLETPFGVTVMTATPTAFTGDVFQLEEEEWATNGFASAGPASLLTKRLHAHKLVELRKASEDAEGPERALRDKLVGAALELRNKHGLRVVAVVANRVARARHVHEALRSAGHASDLLIGPTRPVDRERLYGKGEGSVLPRIEAGRDRDRDEPGFVVSTQTIEVGADLDFDGMVSELASADALFQRFGRLDRLGVRGTTRGIIVASAREVKTSADPDSIYGSVLPATWKWLEQNLGETPSDTSRKLTLDLGPAAIRRLRKNAPPPDVPLLSAPVLLPAHVDLLSQTSPIPAVAREVSLFLHGPVPTRPEVSVVWLADLKEGGESGWGGIVELLPPRTGEEMKLPYYPTVRWLNGQATDFTDMEEEGGRDTEAEGAQSQARPALRWRWGEEPRVLEVDDLTTDEIRPGDILIVPSKYGGADSYGWAPDSTAEVPDVADRAGEKRSIRLDPDLAISYASPDQLEMVRSHLQEAWEAYRDDDQNQLRATLEGMARGGCLDSETTETVKTLLSEGWQDYPYPDPVPCVLLVAKGGQRSAEDRAALISGEEDRSSFSTEILLSQHAEDVAVWTRTFASDLGLAPGVVDDLALAGRLHDIGKADPRFQAFLRGSLSADDGRVLAKSPGGRRERNARAVRVTRRAAGLPDGYRHEATSSVLLSSSGVPPEANDPVLVQHLVESHHGAARPFLPPVADTARAVRVELGPWSFHGETAPLSRPGDGPAQRFSACTRRYGWWGLAYLEALLRLADWTASKEGDT